MKYMTVLQNELTTKKNVNRRTRQYLLVPKNCDPLIHFSLLVLAVFGLLMIASASMGLASNRPVWYLVFVVAKQLVFLVGGFIAMMWIIHHFKLKFMRSNKFIVLCFIELALLVLCLAFPAVGGAKAWIRIPVSTLDVSIQPSEFAKILVPMIVASYCGDVKKTFKKDLDMFKTPLFWVIVYIVIVLVFQSDLGSAAVIGFITLFCVLIPRHKQMRSIQRFLWFVLFAGFGAVVLLLSEVGENIIIHLPLREYQINRFLSSINPFIDQYNTGFQLVSGLVSFATGGWRGLGFGNSVRKYTNFPAANTDFILAIVVEELGMIGFALVFVPYMIIILCLFRYAIKIKSEKGRIILVGTAMYVIIHSLFNVGGVTGLIPLTGVPLLMISSGGSSTLSFMMAIGVAQAVIAQYNRGEIQ